MPGSTTHEFGGGVSELTSIDSKLRTGGTDTPLSQVNETMSAAATGFSTPFLTRGDGFVSALVSCVDTNAADGEFYICIADTQAAFAAGTYKQLPIPELSKIAGAALVAEPLQSDKPGMRWACVRYVRSAGGAVAEITLAISAW